MNIPNGLLSSPEDRNDVLSSQVIPAIKRYPKEFPPPFDLTVSNQGTSPSCVGHASASLRQRLTYNQRIDQVFDGEWIYRRCKEIDGLPNTEGTFFRAGMKVLQKQGAKPINGNSNPANYRIGAYAQVNDLTFEGLKKLIVVYGSVLAGYRGTNEGWREAVVRAPKAGEKTWGHAVILIGYLPNYLIIHNSWGKDKGQQGIFYAPFDYLPFEAWVCLSDLPIIESSITGWAAKKYITEGTTNANLRLRDSAGLSGNLVKLLPAGTSVEQISNEEVFQDGYIWVNIRVL